MPGRIQALNHVRLKYACKACEQCVKLAPGPVVPVPGGIAGAGLMAHARRYFFDAQSSQDKELAQAALAMIGKLYDVERVLKESGAAEEEIARIRGERARPLLDAMGAWLERHKGKVLPKSPMGQAIQYALGNWQALNRYTEQGYLSVSVRGRTG